MLPELESVSALKIALVLTAIAYVVMSLRYRLLRRAYKRLLERQSHRQEAHTPSHGRITLPKTTRDEDNA